MATTPWDAEGDGRNPADNPGGGGGTVLPEGRHTALRERLFQHLRATLSSKRGELLNEEDLRVQLSKLAEKWLDKAGQALDYHDQETAVAEALSEVFGYGPIDTLMRDREITDIFVNGARQLYFEKGGQLHAATTSFRDEEHLLQVIGRMLAASGRRIDKTTRLEDLRLPDGSRVNVVLTPPALNGPLVSVRRFGARPLMADDLLSNESLTKEMLDFLAACVRARINLIVSGGAGTGKTTLLNALSRFIPESERVVTIEDTAELQLQQRHVAKMEALTASPEEGGSVSMRDLVKNSLRMRPDRIIVGECRGGEVLDMLQAMNTGHEGSMTTIHANDPREAVARIELMVAMSGIDMPVWAVRRLTAASLNLVVQASRLAGGRRKVVAISEITGMEGDIVSMHPVFEFLQTGVDAAGAAAGYFRATGIRPKCLAKMQIRGANLPPQMFAERVLHAKKDAGGPRR
jgi:pilus assembly protein CpaF